MALFEEQITDTLETGAPPIKYEGDEGPQDPRQEQMLAQLKEEYMQYVFSQNELGEPVLSFEEWYQMVYEASKMGVQAPQEEMMSEEMMMREPAAYGGIMDTESGRRAYGLGSFFKKITKPIKKIGSKLVGGVKKIAKSPVGKIGIAALLAGAPIGAAGGWGNLGSATKAGWFGKGSGIGALRNMMSGSNLAKKVAEKVISKGDGSLMKNLAKLGIGAATTLPFLGIGTQKQEQVVPDMGKLGSFDFDYDQMIRDVKGAKTTQDFADINTKYGTDLIEDETVYAADGGSIIEKIKEGIMEGGKMDEAIWIEKIKDFIRKKRGDPREEMTQEEIIEQLRPRDPIHPMPMQPPMRRRLEEMPRRGYALGSKADFAIEDIMTGGVEDEIGGITGIMRQADLQRKGNIGQFYAAEGGVAGMREALKNKGYDWLDNADDTTVRQIFNSEMGTWTASDVWRPGKQEGGPMMQASYGYDDAMGESWAEFQRLRKLGEIPLDLEFDEWLEMQDVERHMKLPSEPRTMAREGGIMDLGGMEKDYRETGGFVELGAEEKADDVPARLSVNEFVMTADAVRGAGDGDIDLGAKRMEDTMKQLEQKGKKENRKMAGFDIDKSVIWEWRRDSLSWDMFRKNYKDLDDEEKETIDIELEMQLGRKGASDMFEVSERLSEVV